MLTEKKLRQIIRHVIVEHISSLDRGQNLQQLADELVTRSYREHLNMWLDAVNNDAPQTLYREIPQIYSVEIDDIVAGDEETRKQFMNSLFAEIGNRHQVEVAGRGPYYKGGKRR